MQVLRDEQHVDDDCAEECDVDGQSNNVSTETKLLMTVHDTYLLLCLLNLHVLSYRAVCFLSDERVWCLHWFPTFWVSLAQHDPTLSQVNSVEGGH